MSKYKYEFGVSVGRSEAVAVYDLIEDWGYDESDLEGRTDEDILDELRGSDLPRHVREFANSWVKRIDG